MAAILMIAGMSHLAYAQSIGCKIVTGGAGGIDNSQADSMLSTDVAGVPPHAQGYWNNLSSSGSGGFVLTNSAGAPVNFDLAWSCGYQDVTGTWLGLGTPDGKLMDAFLVTWGPGNASPLGNSPGNSSINNQPIVYVGGLNTWYKSEPGAEGYSVVLYTTGNSYWETAEGYLESVSGSPTNNTMVEGTDLTPHLFEQDQSVYTGTYIPVTSTSLGSPTGGGNYMFFTGLTNDAVLIRLQCHGYGAGLNAFQFVPIFPAPPTPQPPVITPSSTVYALVPVTLTETATGDPFHPQLWYQWYSDDATGGGVTNGILNATNATLNVTPTNNVSTYNIQYVCMVSNIFGASTSAVATLTVNPAVAPFVTQDTTPGPGNGLTTVYAYEGGSISFSAAFGGTPGAYLWESNSVSISGATSPTLTLNNLPLSASASYDLTCTNQVGGAATTPAPLVVLADPAAPTPAEAYPYDIMTNSPVAYWRLNETIDPSVNSVQAFDYSGNYFDGTYGIGTTDNNPGPQPTGLPGFESGNTAAGFTHGGTSSSIVVPPLNLNANAVTITAWINPNGTIGPNTGLFIWANGDDKAGFGFGNNISGTMAELGYVWNSNSPASYNYNSGLYPVSGVWSFVALTITPTNSTIYLYYINGGVTNLLKSVQTVNNQVERFNGGTTWIGSDTYDGRDFDGLIDEVAVFNKSLSEVQLQDLFLKGIGASGVPVHVEDAMNYPTASVYSGQNVRLTAAVSGTVPVSMQWQSSPDGTTWTDVPGATSSSLLANPLTVGTVYYHLTAHNSISSATNNPDAVTFTALPSTPPGLWTVNYQVTNNVLGYTTGAGIGHYSGRGILGTGSYWNVLPDNQGAFGYIWQLTSASDLRDDGATHSGIYCSVYGGCSGFGSSTNVQPDSSDIANLLYQWVTVYNTNNSLQFYGLPDGTYNLCFYGCDGYFNDRGTTFVAHDAKNGDQSAGTVNGNPILPLQQGVNFVVMSNVHVAGGTLFVDIKPTSPVPTHDPNGEADFNGVQLQLVSYDAPLPSYPVSYTYNPATRSMSLNWSQGILETATNVLGPWTPIYSPAPLVITATNAAQFFRTQVP